MAPGDGSMAERCAVADADSDRLQLRFPLARVDPDVLFVDDGAVLTSAGSGPG
jgi:transcriptional regulator GlxA family with amidase domain